jgi:hypothetical protein
MGAEVLAVLLRVAAAAAVAQGDVEEPVGPEGETAAVVVREGLGHEQDALLAARIRDVPCRRVRPELGDVGVAVAVGVVDEEAAVLGVTRVEGEAEEAPLPAARDAAGDVEEGRRHDRPVPQDANAPALLHDEDPAVAGGGLQVEGLAEAAGHPGGGERRLAGDRRRGTAETRGVVRAGRRIDDRVVAASERTHGEHERAGRSPKHAPPPWRAGTAGR